MLDPAKVARVHERRPVAVAFDELIEAVQEAAGFGGSGGWHVDYRELERRVVEAVLEAAEA